MHAFHFIQDLAVILVVAGVVFVAGVHRGGRRILNPTALEALRAGDEVLILGTPVQNREFKQWLRERPEEAAYAPPE
jgi:Trk K+ transport system NAD-binding subunit